MNSTEFYIAAGEAIAEWLKTHNNPCVLFLENKKVGCKPAPKDARLHNYTLYITKSEMNRGMEQSRWNSIGSALHNLYCKELTWPKHQKH